MLLAIDPGPTQSAYVLYDGIKPLASEYIDNDMMLLTIADEAVKRRGRLAVEMIESFGMAVGAEVFQTCVWIGRFVERWCLEGCYGNRHTLVYRKEVKLHLCQSMRAKDSNIRQALIDRFGGSKQVAVGCKAKPGPLYGVKKDVWSALAIAVTWWDTRRPGLRPVQSVEAGGGVLVEERDAQAQADDAMPRLPQSELQRKPAPRPRKGA